MAQTYNGSLLRYVLDSLVGKSIDIEGFAGTPLSATDQNGTQLRGITRIVGTINKVESKVQNHQPSRQELHIEFVSGLKLRGIHLDNPTSSMVTINNANPYGLDFYGINDDGTASTGDFDLIDNFGVNSPFTINIGESLEGLYIFVRGGSSGDTFNTPISATLATDQLTPAGGQIVFNAQNFGNEFLFHLIAPTGTTPGTYNVQFEFSGGGTTQTAMSFQVIVVA
jgi:hypothetical protein